MYVVINGCKSNVSWCFLIEPVGTSISVSISMHGIELTAVDIPRSTAPRRAYSQYSMLPTPGYLWGLSDYSGAILNCRTLLVENVS